jgi:uncharacterized protein YutE (UPF0331/DUF86 family)
MAELREQIQAEKENVEVALANLREALSRSPRSVIELAASATFLHNVYNGIENILKQVLKTRAVEVPGADAWHQELLKRAASAGVIPGALAQELKDYLGFRHFFVHGYGFMLTEEPLQDLASRLPAIWERFMAEIERGLGP